MRRKAILNPIAVLEGKRKIGAASRYYMGKLYAHLYEFREGFADGASIKVFTLYMSAASDVAVMLNSKPLEFIVDKTADKWLVFADAPFVDGKMPFDEDMYQSLCKFASALDLAMPQLERATWMACMIHAEERWSQYANFKNIS